MNRYEVSREASEDNEMNYALLQAAQSLKNTNEQQMDDAKRGKAAHDIQGLLSYGSNLDVEIAGHMDAAKELFAKHGQDLHAEALAERQGVPVTYISVEQIEMPDNVIPIHRAASEQVPADIPRVAAAL